MQKILLSSLVVGSLVALSGCAYITPPVKNSPVNGYIYSNVDWDGGVVSQDVRPEKTGKSCAKSVLGIVGYGDASISAAQKAGGITKIHSINHSSTNYVIFFGNYCTIVTGE